MSMDTKELADVLEDLGQLADIGGESGLAAALSAGSSSVSFVRLVARLCSELSGLHGIDESVTEPKTADANAGDNTADNIEAFHMELAGFLREYGSPYSCLATVSSSSTASIAHRLEQPMARQLLLHYLATEVQAARLILRTRPSALRGPAAAAAAAASSQESDVAAHLRQAVTALELGRPPDGVTAGQLFSRFTGRVSERIASAPDGHLGQPLINPDRRPALSAADWAKALDLSARLAREYATRRRLLLDRLDATISSFFWSDRVKKERKRVEAVYQPLRAAMEGSGESLVTAAQLLASRDWLLALDKIDSGEARLRALSSVNKIRMGTVPDRGGRAWELEPPPPEMPAFKQRETGGSDNWGGGRGGGGGGGGGGRGGRGGGGGGGWQQNPPYQQQQQQQGGFSFAPNYNQQQQQFTYQPPASQHAYEFHPGGFDQQQFQNQFAQPQQNYGGGGFHRGGGRGGRGHRGGRQW